MFTGILILAAGGYVLTWLLLSVLTQKCNVFSADSCESQFHFKKRVDQRRTGHIHQHQWKHVLFMFKNATGQACYNIKKDMPLTKPYYVHWTIQISDILSF